MAIYACGSKRSQRFLFPMLVLVLCLSAGCSGQGADPSGDSPAAVVASAPAAAAAAAAQAAAAAEAAVQRAAATAAEAAAATAAAAREAAPAAAAAVQAAAPAAAAAVQATAKAAREAAPAAVQAAREAAPAAAAAVQAAAATAAEATAKVASATVSAATSVTLRHLISEAYEELREDAESVVERVVQSTVVQTAAEAGRTALPRAVLYLISVLGQQNYDTSSRVAEMAIRFLSEGGASGLNVIAVYVIEILKASDIDVQLPFSRFTPEAVTMVVQWGLAAIVGYFVLSVLLSLLIFVLRVLFWLVKTALKLGVVALFGAIMIDGGATEIIAVRLAALVLGAVLFGRVSGSGIDEVGSRLSCLEGRLKAVESSKEKE